MKISSMSFYTVRGKQFLKKIIVKLNHVKKRCLDSVSFRLFTIRRKKLSLNFAGGVHKRIFSKLYENILHGS